MFLDSLAFRDLFISLLLAIFLAGFFGQKMKVFFIVLFSLLIFFSPILFIYLFVLCLSEKLNFPTTAHIVLLYLEDHWYHSNVLAIAE